jgi:hypothetical protein
MLTVPVPLKDDYTRLLTQRSIPAHSHYQYLRWMRFYLDFCNKYHHDPTLLSSLPLFIRKLHEKNQTPRQQNQAAHAIRLYYELKTTMIYTHTVKSQTIKEAHSPLDFH